MHEQVELERGDNLHSVPCVLVGMAPMCEHQVWHTRALLVQIKGLPSLASCITHIVTIPDALKKPHKQGMKATRRKIFESLETCRPLKVICLSSFPICSWVGAVVHEAALRTHICMCNLFC